MVIYTLLRAHDQDRAVGVSNDRIGDAAHKGTPQPTAPAAAHHDQASTQLLA
jgi:hypothetical protein